MPTRTQLLELNELARDEGRAYPKKRVLHDRIRNARGKHFIGVVGPRGVGKTVCLKQIASLEESSFYLSLDTLEDEDLFALVKGLSTDYGIDLFLLDEAHFRKDFDAVLKKVFDFLDVRVFFTSSVSLSMFDSAFDLSRRVRLLTLPPFSFREYLLFQTEQNLPVLTLHDIMERRWNNDHLFAAPHFERYLRGGVMPFSLEEPDVLPLLENILGKILAKDIPSVARVTVDEIDSIKRMLRFIGRSEVDGINYSSIARNVGVTKYKAESYVNLLEKAFVLQQVFPGGANVLREPKVLMSLPYRLLYRDYDDAIGGLREDFFAEMMRAGALEYQYLKTKRGAKTPDYLVREDDEEMVVEVGGKGKGRSQFKGVNVEKKLILSHSGSLRGLSRPLHLLGFVA